MLLAVKPTDVVWSTRLLAIKRGGGKRLRDLVQLRVASEPRLSTPAGTETVQHDLFKLLPSLGGMASAGSWILHKQSVHPIQNLPINRSIDLDHGRNSVVDLSDQN